MSSSAIPPFTPSPTKGRQKRPTSLTIMRPSPRSNSRLSMASKTENNAGSMSNEEAPTAVKVAIRVRPPLQSSEPGYDLIPQRFRGSTCEVTTPTNLLVQSPQGKKLFVFDRVFDESVTQQGVWEYISESVESFIHGYNVSILAYGQSGAGKSYTMGTSAANEQVDNTIRGIVPRAAATAFHQLAGVAAAKSGLRSPKTYSTANLPTMSSMPRLNGPAERDWSLKVTYVEIYNEQFRDLLVPDSVPQSDRQQVAVREDRKGHIYLTGLTEIEVNSVEELLDVLHFGSAIRQTDATSINEKSSRSHAVFTLNLVQKKTSASRAAEKRRSLAMDTTFPLEEPIRITSKLHFVDLAGSERLKNTGAQGDRAKEGISINAGLASLGKVISQLSSRSHGGHISYRDSKLTRLLQDSLGGIAITYMIACINPAEFHLSETLNTLTYAQRARAIQSKPEIQQSLSESDKNAQIDRLKAEVSFLRGQMTLDRSEKRLASPFEPSTTKVHQLESQLMDMQETYKALNQRHEKLITELGRSTDASDIPLPEHLEDRSAVDRIERSNSFTEAVESVVLEYEKTIQSLESSLHNTRSSLSTTESNLLERESKIAHLEAAAQQNQRHLERMAEKEAHTEQYLQQLESQLEGAATNEESTSVLIQGLRKELTRAKQSQTSTEGYITTLEHQLTGAEEDHVVLKRELERLEMVVERQRMLGQNNIHAQSNGQAPRTPPSAPIRIVNGEHDKKDAIRSRSPPSPLSANATPVSNMGVEPVSPLGDDELDSPPRNAQGTESMARSNPLDAPPANDAQSQFMADKVETLTQELFDLRGEHETTINDFDELRRKYAIALQSLANVKEGEDKNGERDASLTPPQRSDSFLGETLPVRRVRGSRGRSASSSGCSSPSRSIRSQTSPISTGKRSVSSPGARLDPSQIPLPGDDDKTLTSELSSPRSPELDQLQENHEKLLAAHREVLDEVGYLRLELQRTRSISAPSPLKKSPFVRRKTSQDVTSTLKILDKANRSFASLRNIALEHFESRPDVRQNFELQLNAIMAELHSKAEHVQQSEAEAATLRRQLDEKAIMLAGLSRERSSLKSRSSVDFSAVSTMRQQLLHSEQQIKLLHKAQSTQEAKLQLEIEALKAELKQHSETPRGESDGNHHDVQALQTQLATWESKHNSAMDAMKGSEVKLLATISSLEAALASSTSGSRSLQDPHSDVIETLQNQIKERTEASQQQAEELAELQQKHEQASRELEKKVSDHELTSSELDEHRNLVKDLQHQVESHQALQDTHEAALISLKQTHTTELEQIREAHQLSLNRTMELQDEHEDALDAMEKEIREHQATSLGLLAGLATILGRPVDYSNFESQVKDLVVSKRDLEAKHTHAESHRKDLEGQLEQARQESTGLKNKFAELQAAHDQAVQQVEDVKQKELKSSRLVQELEDQLTSNYDHNHKTTKRLSQMQTEKHLQLQEALHARLELEKDLEDSKMRIAMLETQIGEQIRRSNSTTREQNGNVRDSLSPEAAAFALARSTSPANNLRRASPPLTATSLPSPPPTMPLPPLPNSPAASSQGFFERGFPSATFSTRPQSPTMTATPTIPTTPDPTTVKRLEETESRIRTVEKHLFAEKQLTATLEEALVDLETAQNKTRQDLEGWRKKALNLEDELIDLRKEREGSRASLQTVEAERELRVRAEQARRTMEERMKGLEMERRRKKKNALNCF